MVRALASLPPMWPGFKSRRRRNICVCVGGGGGEFVDVYLPCSERFFSGCFGFCPLFTNQHFQIHFHLVGVLPLDRYLFFIYCLFIMLRSNLVITSEQLSDFVRFANKKKGALSLPCGVDYLNKKFGSLALTKLLLGI